MKGLFRSNIHTRIIHFYTSPPHITATDWGRDLPGPKNLRRGRHRKRIFPNGPGVKCAKPPLYSFAWVRVVLHPPQKWIEWQRGPPSTANDIRRISGHKKNALREKDYNSTIFYATAVNASAESAVTAMAGEIRETLLAYPQRVAFVSLWPRCLLWLFHFCTGPIIRRDYTCAILNLIPDWDLWNINR